MVMTYVVAQNHIESRFKANWPTSVKALLCAENIGKLKPYPPYVRLTIRHAASEQKSIGGGFILYRRDGIVIAQCFSEVRKGVKPARLLADTFVAIFEGQQFGTSPVITCRESAVNEIGVSNDMYQVNASVMFDWDATVAV